MGDLLHAWGLDEMRLGQTRLGRALLRALARPPSAEFARQMCRFDDAVGAEGLQAGGALLCERYTGGVRASGLEHVLPEGALLTTTSERQGVPPTPSRWATTGTLDSLAVPGGTVGVGVGVAPGGGVAVGVCVAVGAMTGVDVGVAVEPGGGVGVAVGGSGVGVAVAPGGGVGVAVGGGGVGVAVAPGGGVGVGGAGVGVAVGGAGVGVAVGGNGVKVAVGGGGVNVAGGGGGDGVAVGGNGVGVAVGGGGVGVGVGVTAENTAPMRKSSANTRRVCPTLPSVSSTRKVVKPVVSITPKN